MSEASRAEQPPEVPQREHEWTAKQEKAIHDESCCSCGWGCETDNFTSCYVAWQAHVTSLAQRKDELGMCDYRASGHSKLFLGPHVQQKECVDWKPLAQREEAPKPPQEDSNALSENVAETSNQADSSGRKSKTGRAQSENYLGNEEREAAIAAAPAGTSQGLEAQCVEVLYKHWPGSAVLNTFKSDIAAQFAAFIRTRDAERADWKARAEQAETQLAGCGVAALGWSRGEQRANPGDWGYSASYQDVLNLREKWEAAEARERELREKLEGLGSLFRDVVSSLAHTEQTVSLQNTMGAEHTKALCPKCQLRDIEYDLRLLAQQREPQ